MQTLMVWPVADLASVTAAGSVVLPGNVRALNQAWRSAACTSATLVPGSPPLLLKMP